MHESAVVASLVARAESVVEDAGVVGAQRIGVRIGALSGIDPEVVRTHWNRYATPLTSDAVLDLVVDDDPVAAGALGASLAYVDVEG